MEHTKVNKYAVTVTDDAILHPVFIQFSLSHPICCRLKSHRVTTKVESPKQSLKVDVKSEITVTFPRKILIINRFN